MIGKYTQERLGRKYTNILTVGLSWLSSVADLSSILIYQ